MYYKSDPAERNLAGVFDMRVKVQNLKDIVFQMTKEGWKSLSGGGAYH